MNHALIHFLYQLTKMHPLVHHVSRHLILNIEVPLIEMVLCPSGSKFITRNSLHSRHDFNLFMSDIDFSVITKKPEILSTISKKRNWLKKLLPNVGECELFLEEEWALKNKLASSPRQTIWEKVYLIRKLGWQRKSLLTATTDYEKEKNLRAINITLERLEQTRLPLNGSEIFRFSGDSPPAKNPYRKCEYSHFLCARLGFDDDKLDLEFKSIGDFERFYLLLPDTNENPQGAEDMLLKQHLMLNELLVAKVSLRINKLEGNHQRAQEIESWIDALHRRGCPTISTALK